MKKLVILLVAVPTVILLAVTACQSGGGENHTPTLNKDMFPVVEEQEAPDDILPAPGLGPQYRANIHQQGVENPWPPIQSTEVTIGNPPNTAQITYRDYIKTEAGQTKNNMFHTYLPGVDPYDSSLSAISVILESVNLPSGIVVTQDDWQWHGADPARQSKTALIIEISKSVMLGEHTFNINIEINGKDYGNVPCTVKVIK